jgi:uncharacterized membrane protein (DUF106 family)
MVVDYIGIMIIAAVACGLSLMTQIVNKIMINEKKADRMTVEISTIQKDLQKLDTKSKEFEQKQEKMMDMNLERMKMQMKPLLVTFLPYIIIFYFITGALAYGVIAPGTNVSVLITGTGHVTSECLGIDQDITEDFKKSLTVGSEDCKITLGAVETAIKTGGKEPINFNSDTLQLQIMPPQKTYIPLPVSLPMVGNSLEWLGTFVLFSFISSIILTKVLKGRYLRNWED